MDQQQALNAIADALTRIENQLSRHFAPPQPETLNNGDCWRWRGHAYGGELIAQPQQPAATAQKLSDLVGVDKQIAIIDQNTRQFLAGNAANHVLLTGGRGCGKSTIVRGIFGKYREQGLRLIETDAEGMAQLPALQPLLAARQEKYILYCDDLSFKEGDALFGRIKTAIDGALSSGADNMLIYATSNRRNLIEEKYNDNLSPLTADGGDIQPLETMDEKIALTDRFGIWLSFYAPDADHYDRIVEHWLQHFGITPSSETRRLARNFADQRGSRNGRIARQFAVSQIPAAQQ